MHNLEKEEYLGDIKYLSRNRKGISVVEVDYERKVFEGWHSHKNSHIVLFLKGGTIEKRRNSSRPLTLGEIAFYRSGEPHLNYQTKFPSKNISLEIEEKLLKDLKITESMIAESIKNPVKTKFSILKMYHECLFKDAFTEDSIEMLLAQFAANGKYFENSANCPVWVKQIYEILNDNWDKTMRLEDLAASLNINPITISKHFPKYFGSTYGEYMRKLKVDKAVWLIRSKKFSLSEIAFRCGFADQSHFIRIFKQQTGFLPKTFQRI